MKEIWKTSSNPQEWKNQSVSWLLPWWWFFWIVSNFAANASLRMTIKADDLNDYFNLNLVTQFSEITSLPMTLIFIAIISRVHNNANLSYQILETDLSSLKSTN